MTVAGKRRRAGQVVARIVTVLGAGTMFGARHTVTLMVPMANEPPVSPLTDQMTDVFGLPVTWR